MYFKKSNLIMQTDLHVSSHFLAFVTMMLLTVNQLLVAILFHATITFSWKINVPKVVSKCVGVSIALSTISGAHFHFNAYADESTATSTQYMSLKPFLKELDDGKIDKVVFQGINPTFLTAYTKEGASYIVKDGFPAYNDPLSPSGPAQIIARVQHAPGVICLQDISDVMKTTAKSKSTSYEMKPMLKHSSYPKEFAYTPKEY